MYEQGFTGELNNNVLDKILYDGIEGENVQELKTPDFVNIMKIAIKNSDALIMGSKELPKELKEYVESLDKPILPHQQPEDMEQALLEFYESKVL